MKIYASANPAKYKVGMWAFVLHRLSGLVLVLYLVAHLIVISTATIGGKFGSASHDDPLWLVLATAAYLKETGDSDILDELVPYDNTSGTETPLYEHLQRALRFTLDRLGPHGLPLIGRADWNDCLNLNCFSDAPGESFQTTANKDGKVAESVFLAGLFLLASQEMIGLAREVEDAGTLRLQIDHLKCCGQQSWGNGEGGLECRLGRPVVPPGLR